MNDDKLWPTENGDSVDFHLDVPLNGVKLGTVVSLSIYSFASRKSHTVFTSRDPQFRFENLRVFQTYCPDGVTLSEECSANHSQVYTLF